MNLPQFNAESSLGPTIGRYRGNACFSNSNMVEVLPMLGLRSRISGREMESSVRWQELTGGAMFARGGSGSGSGSGSKKCNYVPIVECHPPPSDGTPYDADPGWICEVNQIEVCWYPV